VRFIGAPLAATGVLAVSCSSAFAIEQYRYPENKPGIFIGSSAGVPGPGIYMFNQVFTFQGNLAGPGVNSVLGGNTKVGAESAVDIQGFLFVPGWTFLGATYDAVLVQSFMMGSLGDSVHFGVPTPGIQAAGVHNTFFIPGELSWKLGDSGFVVKTGLGIFAPDGTVTGVNGTGNIGSPYWTFEPELIVSYLKDGWNLSAALYEELNTKNSISQYTTGDILHADFTVTKTIDKWTFGPVAYYYGQVTNDSCGVGCLYRTGTLGNPQKFNIWAVGGLVGYNFGPAQLSVWATQEISAKASNPAAVVATGADLSLVPQGMTVLATLSYRLWGPEKTTQPSMFHK
jgi:hypothetical protein